VEFLVLGKDQNGLYNLGAASINLAEKRSDAISLLFNDLLIPLPSKTRDNQP
jgi:hypothetical protein